MPDTKTQKPQFSVAITTPVYQNMIHNTLKEPKRASRFIASITSAVAVNPDLQTCDASTILAGALLGESLELSPSPQLGQFYLVPFECRVKGKDGKALWILDDQGKHILDKNGKWKPVTEKKAQFVIGYRGYIQLALRSGVYADLDAMEVKYGEYLGKDNTGKPRFKFIEDDDEREVLPVMGYMAYLEYLNGFKKVLYWSRKKMLNHADQYSSAFSAADYQKIQNGEIAEKDMWQYSSYWYKDFDGMAKKTMLRQLISKWGVMSIQLQDAVKTDQNFVALDEKQNGFLTTDEEAPEVIVPESEPVSEAKEEEFVDLKELEEYE